MMPSNTHYKLFVFLCSIVWLTLSVSGDFNEPPEGAVLYERQFSTIQIPWRFSPVAEIFRVTWKFTKRGTSDEEVFYITDKDGNFAESQLPKPKNHFTGRAEFTGDLANGQATLSIKDFTKDDEGDYLCQILSQVGVLTSTVTIRASVLSNVTEFKAIHDDDKVVEGDNVTLSCTTTRGEPSPKIEIRKGTINEKGRLLNSSMASNTSATTLTYNFERISRDMRGSYFCQVSTSGFTSEKNLTLNVLYPPKIKDSVKSKQSGCPGKSISIDCAASGDPEPNVQIIGPDGKRVNNPFVLKTFGIYRCEASSELGRDSRNITVGQAEDAPTKPIFSECKFTNLVWQESDDKSVKYTLQVREKGSSAWSDVLTQTDTSYSPFTNKSLDEMKDYEFKIIATNCVGETESDVCDVEGKNPTSGESSGGGSNAGVIAGSVIAVLVVILIIVIVAVYCRKRKRDSPVVKVNKQQSQPKTESSKAKNTYQSGALLYSDSPNVEHVRPPAEYRQSEDDDDFDDDDDHDNHDYVNGPSISGNVPSWV